jgi:hypothetical protein
MVEMMTDAVAEAMEGWVNLTPEAKSQTNYPSKTV